MRRSALKERAPWFVCAECKEEHDLVPGTEVCGRCAIALGHPEAPRPAPPPKAAGCLFCDAPVAVDGDVCGVVCERNNADALAGRVR